eukprot:jgi/Botrbrau1/4677/Bobra.33_2s0040.1
MRETHHVMCVDNATSTSMSPFVHMPYQRDAVVYVGSRMSTQWRVQSVHSGPSTMWTFEYQRVTSQQMTPCAIKPHECCAPLKSAICHLARVCILGTRL